ncbi:hypothetical protein Fmac_007200 [Flemingia macrophylla]|uniref:Uncharacterized protein n=1 Tax=Flemingia macrophylla TaxID=520843 RepID=A0ABD1NCR8_9FABA
MPFVSPEKEQTKSLEKNEEEFEDYLNDFALAVWTLLGNVSQSSSHLVRHAYGRLDEAVLIEFKDIWAVLCGLAESIIGPFDRNRDDKAKRLETQ